MQVFLGIFAVGIVGFGLSALSGFEAALIFLLVYCGIVLVSGWVLSVMAKRQMRVEVPASRQTVVGVIEDHFKGVGWQQVPGRGEFNFKARGIGISSFKMENPVISIDLPILADGGTGVEIWMSEWMTKFFTVGACDRVVSKRWTLVRKLAQVGQPGPRVP